MSKARKSPLQMFRPAETTGELIKAFRNNFGISQAEMATTCKITPSHLSEIENDKRAVTAQVAVKLSAFMGLSPEIILYPAGYQEEPDYQEVRERSTISYPMAAKGRT